MTRAYASPLRAEQARLTRERILDAMTDQLAEGSEDFSMERVAAEAGVSVRTVYHHFPNREAQIEAVARWLEQRMGPVPPAPGSLAQVPAFAELMIRRAMSSPRDMRAHVAGGIAKAVRKRRRAARDRALGATVARDVAAPVARLAAAALGALIAAEVGVAMLDRFGLDDDEVVATHAWIVRVVVDAIRRGDLPEVRRDPRPPPGR